MKHQKDKKKDLESTQTDEEKDFHQEIKLQIQKVTKETATLIGLLEGGLQNAGIDSPEYKSMRKFGTTFLNDLVRVARSLNVQLQ